MTMGGFFEDEDSELIHVYPVGDIKEHLMSCNCWCKPSAHESEPDVIVHNSADSRELFDGASATAH